LLEIALFALLHHQLKLGQDETCMVCVLAPSTQGCLPQSKLYYSCQFSGFVAGLLLSLGFSTSEAAFLILSAVMFWLFVEHLFL